jgi:hypothetical protein
MGHLPNLWRKVQLGQASEQERIDAASLTAKRQARAFLPQLKGLLRDDSDNVRYFALHALVLGLKEETSEVTEVCWRLLATDPDEDVRHVAAAGLGRIYSGQRRRDVFQRLAQHLRSETQTGHVKGGIYNAMHELAGLPPSEWPLTYFPRRVFQESDIDWGKVAALEDAME